MDTIKELKAEVARLKEELLDARRRLEAAHVAALPWRVGSVVRCTSGVRVGELFKVTRVLNAEHGRPYVVAKKKDGSFGVREFGLFSGFEVVTL